MARLCNLISSASETTPLIFPITVFKNRTRERDTLSFVFGNLFENSCFQDLRRMVMVFSRVNDCPRPLRGCLASQPLGQEAMNAAGAWRSVELHAGHCGGDFLRFRDRFHQAAPVGFRARVLDFQGPNLRDLDAVRVRDVHGETSSGCAHRVHDIRHHFRNHQPAEIIGPEGFIKKQSSLDGAEAEPNEGALTGKFSGVARGWSQLSVEARLRLFMIVRRSE